ncbi:50S ribosomal protein L37ae [Candidatus Woesearchaeota archaeon]|nr:50S ribosomal protein L37ae [Candidatus Woesearchaeota archaeon]
MATKKMSFTGGFGSRYGAPLRQKLINAIKKQKTWQKCPHCSKNRVKKVAYGIWHCRACNTKFAGRAYEI